MHSTHAYLPAIPADALGHGALGIPKESSIGPSARFAPLPSLAEEHGRRGGDSGRRSGEEEEGGRVGDRSVRERAHRLCREGKRRAARQGYMARRARRRLLRGRGWTSSFWIERERESPSAADLSEPKDQRPGEQHTLDHRHGRAVSRG